MYLDEQRAIYVSIFPGEHCRITDFITLTCGGISKAAAEAKAASEAKTKAEAEAKAAAEKAAAAQAAVEKAAAEAKVVMLANIRECLRRTSTVCFEKGNSL